MKLLTIYAVQDTLKFSLFDMKDESVIADGLFERIGMEGSRYFIHYSEEQIMEEMEITSFEDVAHILLDILVSLNIISGYEDIAAIGHKLLFGGDYFKEKTFLSEQVISKLKEYSEYYPLKASIQVIESFSRAFPFIDMIGVFDTSFYQTLSPEAFLYGVPYSWYSNYGVRKYGSQGLVHQYAMKEIQTIVGKNDIKIISCFLDSKSSVSAIDSSKCIDTSMGFSHLTGLIMGTKSGDVDPSIIPYIMEKEGKNVGEVLDDLNYSSGLLGISECSADMRDILALCDDEHPKVVLAKNMYVRKIVEYIAQYYVLLNGVDVIVFSGFIGENNGVICKEVCDKLNCLGVKIDLDKIFSKDKFEKISTEDSSVSVYIISSNEELMMVREMLELKDR